MLKMIETLINEHGSSVIMKERLSLINDRYEQKERELKKAIEDINNLQAENVVLKNKLDKQSQGNELYRFLSAAYNVNENQEPYGVPYCLKCKTQSFTYKSPFMKCTTCGQEHHHNRVPPELYLVLYRKYISQNPDAFAEKL
ncbi:hypothetical protein [Photobacterium kishitanii]|uniref:hypothetical protein n=1 Tax=Photobacterium kishitanii TaxID=318456 RepID=UPI0007F870C7|nr:hypothetical protein [Photobacterium kishitanii]OBU27011.1 hypothetical protein AYY23_09405 [Photobacterium kishitanii]PSW51446.1 hypothetical protein C0W66_01060 [Photobacterium kishitanii]